ncbi:MAG TPA: heterodisulfide reductase-related iron-sulfur binding cluster [Acidobacteriota bacterium]|nr:heterodisulfide reductase-related iron-sulfur binding cluster [Acidobacteriota bacterium]
MPPLSEATRPLMWNISQTWVMYLLFSVALAVFTWGMHRRIQFWRQGKAEAERFGDWLKRLDVLVREILFQKRVRHSSVPGVFHSLIFYSFALLFITTVVIMFQYDVGRLFGPRFDIFRGYLYVFLSVASEAAGVLVLAGIILAAYRRYSLKPETLPSTRADGLALLFLAGIIVTGFLTEGLRIAVNGDPWKTISPVGWGVSILFGGAKAGKVIHSSVWWAHAVLAMSWIALVPYTKFVHLLSLPTNVFFSKLEPRGALKRMDLERVMESVEGDAELRIGIQEADDLTWKQRLDTDACISCGRCDEICPAHMAQNEQFTPRQFIAHLKEALSGDDGAKSGQPREIIGNLFDEEFIWHCRTCTACMEVCPGLIEHVDTLMELRRNEVLIKGRMPADAARALRMLETHGNPFGPQSDRVDWISQLNIRVVNPGERVDVLYWIGCCATFDPQKRKIATDLCRLMKMCGIDFGVLGAEEKCCGDPARIIGQEMLFQQIAKEQVEILKKREFQVLITSCPHCYNVLAHEYKQFGADFHVAHHSEFLHEMLWLGKLKPRSGMKRRCVYHDPCYLGRYQKIYDSPREVITALPGAQLIEMRNHRDKSMCCGAGGGHYWMDLKSGERINNLRVKQACEVGADTIVTGCAYCLHMLEDSLKLLNREDTVQVIDLGSLLLEGLENSPKVRVSSETLRPQ